MTNPEANLDGNPDISMTALNETTALVDQQVIIELTNSSSLKFEAGWNNGLGIFIFDYEWFMRGRPQPSERYSMQTYDSKQNHQINLKFETIVAIHLAKKQ